MKPGRLASLALAVFIVVFAGASLATGSTLSGTTAAIALAFCTTLTVVVTFK